MTNIEIKLKNNTLNGKCLDNRLGYAFITKLEEHNQLSLKPRTGDATYKAEQEGSFQ